MIPYKTGYKGGTEIGLYRPNNEMKNCLGLNLLYGLLIYFWLVDKVLHDNPFNSTYFAWTDCSVSRWTRPFLIYIFKNIQKNQLITSLLV